MDLPTHQVPGFNPNANRGPGLNAAAIAFTCISFTTLVCRAFSRLYTEVAFGLDDWLIVPAALSSWAFTALGLAAVQRDHLGQHVDKIDKAHVENFLKLTYAAIIIFGIALTLSKLSLLALYWRIFGMTNRRPLQTVAIMNVAWMIAAMIVAIFICVPINGFWDSTKPSKCVNYPVLFIANEAITLVFDLFVLLLPVYFISQIQRSLAERLSMSSTFLLGLIATVISAVRLWQLAIALHLPGPDQTYNDTNHQLYGDIELNMWIVVASVPALRPLVGKVIRDRRARGSGSTNSRRRIWFKMNSFLGIESTVLRKCGRRYSHGDGRLPLNGIDPTASRPMPLRDGWPHSEPWAAGDVDPLEIQPPKSTMKTHAQKDYKS